MWTAYAKTIQFLFAITSLGFLVSLFIKNILHSKSEFKIISISGFPNFFLMGTGIYTAFELFFSMLNIPAALSHFWLLFFIFSTLNFWLYTQKGNLTPYSFSFSWKNKYFILSTLSFLFISFLLSVKLILNMSFPEFDIDLIAHLLMKAKALHLDTYASALYFHDPAFSGMHARYPPWIGMTLNLMMLFGGEGIACYQIINHFIFFAIGWSLFNFLKQYISIPLCCASFFIFISTREFLSSQFIIDSLDVTLSLGFLLTSIDIINSFKDPHPSNLYEAGLYAGICALIKNEGLVFFILSFGLLFIYHRKKAVAFAGAAAAIALPWWLYSFHLTDLSTRPENFAQLQFFMQSITTFIPMTLIAFKTFLLKWNGVFLLIVFAFFMLRKSKFKLEVNIFSFMTISMIAIYFIMVWPQIGRTSMFQNTFSRIIGHVYPMAFICVWLALDSLMQNPNLEQSKS